MPFWTFCQFCEAACVILKEAVQGYFLDKLFKVQKSYTPFKPSFYLLFLHITLLKFRLILILSSKVSKFYLLP